MMYTKMNSGVKFIGKLFRAGGSFMTLPKVGKETSKAMGCFDFFMAIKIRLARNRSIVPILLVAEMCLH